MKSGRVPTGSFLIVESLDLGFGDTVPLNLDQELAGRKRHEQKVVINGDRLAMSDTDGTSVTFQQVP